MWTRWSASYNGAMTTTTPVTAAASTSASDTSRFAAAGIFLDRLAAGDFTQLTAALEPDARLSALLPRGFDEWEGRDEVGGAFDSFFGGMDEYEVLDASVGLVGDRLRLRWRIHARGGRLGPQDFVAEQSCYADAGPTGRLQFMALVCSGFRRDHTRM